MGLVGSGSSVEGRQVLFPDVPAGAVYLSVSLPNVTQGREYAYKGFISVEDFRYEVDLQMLGVPVYWEGVTIWVPYTLPFPTRLVAYWRYSGLEWTAVTSP